MSRSKKKPDYDPVALKSQLFNAIAYSYNHPAADEAVDKATHEAVGGHKKIELVAEEFSMSRLKIRKILITTGDYSTPQTTQIKKMRDEGKSTAQIAEKLGLENFRRHILQCAYPIVLLIIIDRSTEVSQFEATPLGGIDIGGLHITMDDIELVAKL